MALKYGRTSKTTTRESDIVITQEKQIRPKSPERIAKEAKYNADLDVYNKSIADQSAAESEYSSSMGKYNKNMETYKASQGTPYESMWGKSLDEKQLARYNAAYQKGDPGGLVSKKIRVGKGVDTEAFTKNFEKDTDYGSGWHLPEYAQPVAPTKRKTTPVSEPVQDWEEEYLPTMKVTGIKTNQKLRVPKEKEELSWQEPVMTEKKGSRIGYTKIKPGGKTGIKNAAHPFNEKAVRPNKIKYNTEGRQAMAYFSGETSIGDKITGKTESELRDLKKETRGEGGRMLKEGRLRDALTIGKDLATIRKATRYAKKGDISIGSKTGSVNEGKGSKLQYFTPENGKLARNDEGKTVRAPGAMSGYKEYKAQEAEKTFRAQYENATNRNTTWDRLQGPSEGSTATSNIYSASNNRAQQKAKFAAANPNATPGQIRRGARDLQKADEEIMKKVGKKQ